MFSSLFMSNTHGLWDDLRGLKFSFFFSRERLYCDLESPDATTIVTSLYIYGEPSSKGKHAINHCVLEGRSMKDYYRVKVAFACLVFILL